MIICFVTVGFVAVSSSMVGVPPVTASGVVLAMLVGVFAYVGFIPALCWWFGYSRVHYDCYFWAR